MLCTSWLNKSLVRAAVLVAVLMQSGCEPARGEVREWTKEDHDGAKTRGQTPQSTGNKDAAPGLANTLWMKTCSTCHGATGRGDGPFAPSTGMPDLTRPDLAKLTDDDLKKVIREGRNAMPANPDIPETVLEALVKRIRAGAQR